MSAELEREKLTSVSVERRKLCERVKCSGMDEWFSTTKERFAYTTSVARRSALRGGARRGSLETYFLRTRTHGRTVVDVAHVEVQVLMSLCAAWLRERLRAAQVAIDDD